MHILLWQCQLQKILNQNAQVFPTLKPQTSNNIDFVNVDICYKKRKVLNQITTRKKNNERVNNISLTKSKNMDHDTVHYISSPDGYSTGSENEVMKKMRQKYTKLQEEGDLWYHTSDKEINCDQLEKTTITQDGNKRGSNNIKTTVTKVLKNKKNKVL